MASMILADGTSSGMISALSARAHVVERVHVERIGDRDLDAAPDAAHGHQAMLPGEVDRHLRAPALARTPRA